MEVEICDPNIITRANFSRFEVLAVRGSEESFAFLLTKQVDSMNCRVLVYQLSEMTFKGRLRGLLRSSNLYPVSKGLNSWLFPKD